jgi:hypothetical protein
VGSGNVKETHPSAFVDAVTNFVRGIVRQLKEQGQSVSLVITLRCFVLGNMKHGLKIGLRTVPAA